MYRVLVADIINSDGVAEIPYLLKKANCEVTVFCPEKSWLLKNKYWDIHIAAKTSDQKEYISNLEKVLQARTYDWVILADDTVNFIANEYLSDKNVIQKIFPVSALVSQDEKKMLGSKTGLHILSQKYRIVSPRGVICQDIGELEKTIEDFLFPALLKTDQGGGGQGVFKCQSAEDAIQGYKNLRNTQKKNILLQEYIQGKIVAAETLFSRGELVAAQSSEVLKNIHGEFSISMIREYGGHELLRSTLREIGNKLELDGFYSFTFMYTASTNTYYLIEADPRPQSWFALAHFAGVNFSEAILLYLSRKKESLKNTEISKNRSLALRVGTEKVVIRHFARNILYSLQQADFKELFSWILNIEGRWKYIPFYDLKFLYFTLLGIGKIWLYPYIASTKRLFRVNMR